MAASVSVSHGAWSNPGNGNPRPAAAVGQSLLNLLAAAAQRAADYSRFQGLSRRYLDDAGLTPAEFDAALGQTDLAGARMPIPTLAHSV